MRMSEHTVGQMIAAPKQADAGHTATPMWKLIAVYYVIACGFARLAWSPLILGPNGLKVLKTSVSLPVFISLGTLGPLLGCFIAHRWETGNWRAVHVIPSRAFLWIWLLLGPLLVIFARVFVFSALLTRGGPAAWRWHVGALVGIWIPMLNYNLFGGPLFEEFGWRGFLQPHLQRTMPPWIAAVVTGVLWASWHLPIFLTTWAGVSFPIFLLILVGLSLVMAFGFNASGQVIMVAILMHSAFNASNRFIPAFLGNIPTRQHPSEGLLIALAFILVAAVLTISTRGRLLHKQAR